MSNFKQALEYLLQGKKIHRRCWREGHFWELNNLGRVVNSINESPIINKSQLEAQDWEIYGEPKCKLCNEYRLLIYNGMCELCSDYLNKRVMRISQDCLKEAGVL